MQRLSNARTTNQVSGCLFTDQSETWKMVPISQMLDLAWRGAVEHQLLSWDTSPRTQAVSQYKYHELHTFNCRLGVRVRAVKC